MQVSLNCSVDTDSQHTYAVAKPLGSQAAKHVSPNMRKKAFSMWVGKTATGCLRCPRRQFHDKSCWHPLPEKPPGCQNLKFSADPQHYTCAAYMSAQCLLVGVMHSHSHTHTPTDFATQLSHLYLNGRSATPMAALMPVNLTPPRGLVKISAGLTSPGMR